jgi:hypothetical protein
MNEVRTMKRQFDFKDVPKPCHVLGFCPYGPLVEGFPAHEEAAKYARDHDMWVRWGEYARGEEGWWWKCKRDDVGATEDLNSAVKFVEDPYSCTEFGHNCPVYYVSEGIVDESEPITVNNDIWDDWEIV